MNLLTRFKVFLWYFSHFKVPLIGVAKPKLLFLDDNKIVVKLRLRRKLKNHLHSMYFGALAIGADIAGGLHGFYHSKKQNTPLSLAFKSFDAQFLKRPEGDVYFVSEMGDIVKYKVLETAKTGNRVTFPICVKAYIDYFNNPEQVAEFTLQLSLKRLGNSLD